MMAQKEFDGRSVKPMNTPLNEHASPYHATFLASLSCDKGVVNIDNKCVCPDVMNSAPYDQMLLTAELYTPMTNFASPTDAQRCLMAERGMSKR